MILNIRVKMFDGQQKENCPKFRVTGMKGNLARIDISGQSHYAMLMDDYTTWRHVGTSGFRKMIQHGQGV